MDPCKVFKRCLADEYQVTTTFLLEFKKKEEKKQARKKGGKRNLNE